MNAIPPRPRPAPETCAERRTRQLDMLRDPGLTFTRATQTVRQAIALEHRIAEGALASRAPQGARERAPQQPQAFDPRRAPLRQALRKLAASEPDRATRTQLLRHIDERIEEELLDDPERVLPLGEPLARICASLGLPLDLTQLPDEFLGLEPRRPDDGVSGPVQAQTHTAQPGPARVSASDPVPRQSSVRSGGIT